jgi:hypothetical protein
LDKRTDHAKPSSAVEHKMDCQYHSGHCPLSEVYLNCTTIRHFVLQLVVITLEELFYTRISCWILPTGLGVVNGYDVSGVRSNPVLKSVIVVQPTDMLLE